jgi:hypothetical protein
MCPKLIAERLLGTMNMTAVRAVAMAAGGGIVRNIAATAATTTGVVDAVRGEPATSLV